MEEEPEVAEELNGNGNHEYQSQQVSSGKKRILLLTYLFN
jgi:hypothetical protein